MLLAMATKRKRASACRIICQNCYEAEDFDDMVNCRKCLKWTHFCCAGVGPKIKSQDWECFRCKAAEMATFQKDLKAIKLGQNEIKASVSELQNDKLNTAKEVNQMKEAVLELKEHVNEITTLNIRGSKPTFRMSMLPSKTEAELNELLHHVNSEAGFSEFKLHVSALCRNTIQKSIRNILFNVMNKDVQKLLSWSGLRTTKPSFEQKYKRIVDALNETLSGKFKDYTYDDLINKVSTLLRNAEY